MSIHFISGKPGGGKSLYGMRLIVDELIHGNRTIITNVPVLLGRLNEYLQQNFPNAYARRFGAQFTSDTGSDTIALACPAVHISDQIILLDEDDLPKFFTFRANGVRLESVNNQQWREGKRPDFSQVKDGGVLYVLDEVHIAFNARAWADTGNEVLYYLSQHRKLGDDVICITQAIANVDKQFRSVAQDYTYIKNLAKQKAGLFRLPGIFMRSTYAQPATDNSKAMESGTFTLDVSGLASCYDTAKGVGIHGRAGADTGHRKKGIHWMWFIVGLPVVLFLLMHYLPQGIQHVLSPSRPRSQVVQPSPAKAFAPSQIAFAPMSATVPFLPETPAVADDVFCYGITRTPDFTMVFLSDGRVASTDNGEIQGIEKKRVLAFGEKFPIKFLLPKSVESSPSSPLFTETRQPYVAPEQDAVPYNPVQVTVIGQSYRDRQPPQSRGGFSVMPRNAQPAFSGNQNSGQSSYLPVQSGQ